MSFQPNPNKNHRQFSQTDFSVRRRDIRKLVLALNELHDNKDIGELWVEKDVGGFLIKIESANFRSYKPLAGIVKIRLSSDEFWATQGPFLSTLKEKIIDGLESL